MKIAEPVQNECEVSLAMTTIPIACGRNKGRQHKSSSHCEEERRGNLPYSYTRSTGCTQTELSTPGKKKWIIIGLLSIFLSGCHARVVQSQQENKVRSRWQLVYESALSAPSKTSDWLMEGPGEFVINKGKLTVIPHAQQAMRAEWERLGRRKLDPSSEYYATVEKALEQQAYSPIEPLYTKGDFSGGHIVLWNRAVETPDSYAIEFDFKPLSPIGLAILFFSASGQQGQDVLSDRLKGRHGVFSTYTKSDINCYHISFWANNAAVGKRGTCNLRKNTGFYNLANGSDPSVVSLDYTRETFNFTTHRIRLEKIRNQITFYIDGQVAIQYEDKQYNDILKSDGTLLKENVDTGEVLEGGRFGLRQMVGLKAEYSDIKVYRLGYE